MTDKNSRLADPIAKVPMIIDDNPVRIGGAAAIEINHERIFTGEDIRRNCRDRSGIGGIG